MEVGELEWGVQQGCNLHPLPYSVDSLKIFKESRASPLVPEISEVLLIDGFTVILPPGPPFEGRYSERYGMATGTPEETIHFSKPQLTEDPPSG